MKKIISILVMMLFMMSIVVIAAPQPPYMLFGHVEWNGAALSGSKLDITVNGIKNTVVTDGAGVWQYSVLYYANDDVITLHVLDGCGTGDTCTKSVIVGAVGTKDYAQVDFDITGTLSCPPTPCPTCGGGGSGGSSCSQYVCDRDYPTEECEEVKDYPIPTYTESNCNVLFPCEETLPGVCDEVSPCPVIEESECPESKGLSVLLELIAVFVLFMGGGLQIYKNRKGGITMLHRHRGILGYHDVNRGHRNPLYDHAGLTENPIQFAKDIKRINA